MPQPSSQPSSEPDDFELAFQLAGVGLCIAHERIIQRCNRAFAACSAMRRMN